MNIGFHLCHEKTRLQWFSSSFLVRWSKISDLIILTQRRTIKDYLHSRKVFLPSLLPHHHWRLIQDLTQSSQQMFIEDTASVLIQRIYSFRRAWDHCFINLNTIYTQIIVLFLDEPNCPCSHDFGVKTRAILDWVLHIMSFGVQKEQAGSDRYRQTRKSFFKK